MDGPQMHITKVKGANQKKPMLSDFNCDYMTIWKMQKQFISKAE